jgi:hypothetical protein
MEFGAVILCVIADGQNAATGDGADFPEHFQELPEGLSIKFSGLAPKQKPAVPQTDGGKIADTLARRMMIYDVSFRQSCVWPLESGFLFG